MSNRGFFEIGIEGCKTKFNMGTLWRSAYQFGAVGIFTINQRYEKQASDTTKTWRHVPLRQFETVDTFLEARPWTSMLVGVEECGDPLEEFKHPERAIYVLGAEDSGLSKQMMQACQHIVRIPAMRVTSYNVAVAGSIVMYDRILKGLL